jgi:hypothetical protein
MQLFTTGYFPFQTVRRPRPGSLEDFTNHGPIHGPGPGKGWARTGSGFDPKKYLGLEWQLKDRPFYSRSINFRVLLKESTIEIYKYIGSDKMKIEEPMSIGTGLQKLEEPTNQDGTWGPKNLRTPSQVLKRP